MLERIRELIPFSWAKSSPKTFGEFWQKHGRDFTLMQNQIQKIREKKISLVSQTDESFIQGIPKARSDWNFAASYESNLWVHVAVRTIAQACSMLDLKTYRKTKDKNGQEVLVESKNGLGYELLQKPSLYQTPNEIKLSMFSSLLYGGNSYLYVDDKSKELWSLLPQNVKIVASRIDFIKNYRFTVKDFSIETDLPPENVVHIKEFSSTNYFYGTSRLSAAWGQASIIDSDLQFWKTFWKSGGRVLGAWSTDSKLSDVQYDRFEKQIKGKYKGLENMFRDMLLEDGLTYTQLGVNQTDAQLIEKHKLNREEILSAYGVPPSMVGILDRANYSNMEVQERLFWQSTCLPILTLFEEALNANTLLSEAGAVVFKFDLSKVAVLQENLAEKVKIATEGIKGRVWTPNEARQRFFGMDPIVGDGDILEPVNSGSNNFFPVQPAKMIAIEDLKKKDDSPVNVPRKPRYNKVSAEEKTALAKAFDDQLKVHDAQVLVVAQKRFRYQKDLILDQIRAYLRETGKDNFDPADVELILKNAKNGQSDFANEMRSVLHDVAKYFGNQSVEQMKRQIESKKHFFAKAKKPEPVWNEQDPTVARYLKERSIAVADTVDETTLQMFRDGLAVQMEDDSSISALTDYVQSFFDGMDTWRAARIARTESGAAASFAMNQTFLQNQDILEQKEWVTAGDEAVRPSHQEVEPVDVLDNFVLGSGAETPSAPSISGIAEEDINCRCTSIGIVKTDLSDGEEE